LAVAQQNGSCELDDDFCEVLEEKSPVVEERIQVEVALAAYL
jgi:hypothetical protein